MQLPCEPLHIHITHLQLVELMLSFMNATTKLSCGQGPSPDEVALVEGGRLLGFEFVRRDRASLTIRMQGQEARSSCLVAAHLSCNMYLQSTCARNFTSFCSHSVRNLTPHNICVVSNIDACMQDQLN